MTARKPPPFASLHREYDESLTALLVAAGALAVQVQAVLDLNQVNVSVAPMLSRRLAAFNHAYYGDK